MPDDGASENRARAGTEAPRSLAHLARELASGTMSRRRVLRLMGGALAGAVLAHFPQSTSAARRKRRPVPPSVPVQHGAELRGIALTNRRRSLEGRFGLMFKDLPAFEPPDELLTGLAASMAEPPDAPPSVTDVPREVPGNPAGYVLLGQFIDHDLTFDNTPLAAQRADPDALTNFRSPHFNLDSVYGDGPSANPQFYDESDATKLRIGDPDTPDDFPRRTNGSAITADPRDDENLITSQLHLAFRKFHNALVDHVRAQGSVGADGVFEEARRLCRWHYQWMVVHDFLPRMVGQDTIDEVLHERTNGPAQVMPGFYKPQNPNRPMMPIEFAVAAYRFGHSMLRPEFVINEEGGSAALFGGQPDFSLNGRRPIPPNLMIAWRHFFDIPGVEGPPANSARRIDSDLSQPLFSLPRSIIPEPDPRVSLAERNLLRGKRLGLPSGQGVAQKMGVAPLSNQELGIEDEPGWGGQAPLWFYILKEAELQHDGERLGAVGGRIVAEVILGLLSLDGNSYLRQLPSFRPEPPIARAGEPFEIGDLLKFAGAA